MTIVFDCADSLSYKLRKISLNRAGKYKDSRKWLKNKKETRKSKKL